jgi:hypothetical protein
MQVHLAEAKVQEQLQDLATQTLVPQFRCADKEPYLGILITPVDAAKACPTDVPSFVFDGEIALLLILEHLFKPLLLLYQGKRGVLSKMLQDDRIVQPLNIVWKVLALDGA